METEVNNICSEMNVPFLLVGPYCFGKLSHSSQSLIWACVLSCRWYLECPTGFKALHLWATPLRALASRVGHTRFLLCHRLSAADACVRKRSLSSVAPPPRHTAYHVGLGFCRTQGDFQSPRSSFSLRQPCVPGPQGRDLVGIPSCCPSQPGSAAPWCLSPFHWWKQSSALLLQASESKGQ